jgi:phosphoribosyl 1,2-cyclic phosphodiesterase
MGLKFCSLVSGSSGNCQFISSKAASLLVDAGLSGKRIAKSMEVIGEEIQNIKGILVTHEHRDHIQGVGVLSRRYNIPIYANPDTWDAMKDQIGEIDEENRKTFNTEEAFYIEDIKIKPYSISHDAIDPVAFSFYHEDVKLSITTDLGCITDKIISEIENSNLLMIESNHDVEMLKVGKYPWYLKKRILGDRGHLSNEVAGQTIAALMYESTPPELVLLGHLSRENNFPELAYETVKGILASNQIKIGKDIDIDLTYRDKVSKLYHIKK